MKMDQKRKKAIVILLSSFILNVAVYLVSRLIAGSWEHTDITSRWDQMIPFLSWTVIIYLGWYALYIANYILAASADDKTRDRFFCADALAKIICFVIFLAFPTTNIRPVVSDTGFFEKLMMLVYYLDAPDNLFPSLHCLVGWFCWIGVRKRKDIPITYRIFSLLAAISICISTLTTKQHVIIDVLSGIALAEGTYAISGISCVRSLYSKIIAGLFRLLRIQCDNT